MRNTKLWRSLMACLLVLVMLVGTMATSFAATIDAEAFVEAVKVEAREKADQVKAIVEDIVAAIESKDADLQKAKITEYVDFVDAELAEIGVTFGPKVDEIAEILGTNLELIIDNASAGLSVNEKIDSHIALFEALLTLTPEQVAVIDMIEAEIDEIIAATKAKDNATIEAKIDEYVANVKAELELNAEVSAVVDVVVAEVKAALVVASDGKVDDAEKEVIEGKVKEYAGIIKAELGITDEDIKNVIDTITDVIETIEATAEEFSLEEIKAAVDAKVAEIAYEAKREVASLGHKHYDAEEGNYYVAIGGDTVRAADISRDDDTYYDLVAAELDIDAKAVTDVDTLLASEVLALIEANATEIAKADLITYQADASAFIYALVSETPDWDKYVDAEVAALINDIIAEAVKVMEADWEAYADEKAAEVVEDVKAKVAEVITNEAVTDYIVIGEAELNNAIDVVVDYVYEAIKLVSDKKTEIWTDVWTTVENLDETVKALAEKLAYSVVAYAVDTVKAIETIQAINPDATLLIVGMYNPLKGLEIVTEDATIDAGEIFEYVIAATNVYYTAYTAVNGNVAFVDVSDATTNGFAAADAIDVTALDVTALGSMVLGMSAKMHANAEGHEYIKDQIIDAITCEYTAYEAVDAEYHAIKCWICGDVKELEEHDFVDHKCTKCGYEEDIPEEEEDPGKKPNRFGGGSGAGKTDALAKYTDLDKNAWYYNYVKEVVEKGLMLGISDTEFGPNVTLTRAMFVTILHRIEKTPKVEGELKFTDVAADQYYAEAVKWANANGIVVGISETEYAPNAEITREQMAAIVARYAEYKKLTAKAEGEVVYTDADQVAEYAKEAVVTAKHLGVLIGNDDGSFAPKRSTTRAEAAALFVRLLNVLGK